MLVCPRTALPCGPHVCRCPQSHLWTNWQDCCPMSTSNINVLDTVSKQIDKVILLHLWTTTELIYTLSYPFTYLSPALSLVHFSSRWYLHTWKSLYTLHPISLKFPQYYLSKKLKTVTTHTWKSPYTLSPKFPKHCPWNCSNVGHTDDNPFSSLFKTTHFSKKRKKKKEENLCYVNLAPPTHTLTQRHRHRQTHRHRHTQTHRHAHMCLSFPNKHLMEKKITQSVPCQ